MQTKGNHIIGVDIGGTKTALSLWTRDARLLEKTKFATEGNADTVIARIVDEIRLLLSGAGLVAKEIIALGISCGGPLDSKAGLILSPPNLPTWDRIPIVERLESATGIRAHLENDANACALAEWYRGAGRGFDNVIFLTFGTGLGAGLILNGKLYRGACDLAGEVGHIRVAETGPLGYGKEGSWEGFCSGGGISRMYAALTGQEASGKAICDAAEAGEKNSLQVIEKSAEYLGRGLAMLIDLLNPERIIIGSIFVRSESLFREHIEEVIKKEALSLSRACCSIVSAQLGEELGDTAAFCVALDAQKRA